MNHQQTIRTLIPRLILGLMCPVFAASAFGQFSMTQIAAFCTEAHLGAKPFARLIQASDGAFYGTTVRGAGELEGTVFKLNQDGTGFRALHAFGSTEGDGIMPFSELLEGSGGALYGTTHLGGSSNEGTVFTLEKDGTGYRVLHSFAGPGEDGATPFAGLIEGSDGKLYGASHYGGSADFGAIYRLNKDGTEFSLLHSFTGGTIDGAQPFASLLEASNGALYGTTIFGGASNQGIVFTLNRDGSNYRILQSFTGENLDGANPYGTLLEDSDGVLYGTTLAGGNDQFGTIYKLNRDGSGYTLLHSFGGELNGGAEPYGALVWGNDEALYGTTASGGNANQGTVYKLSRNGDGYSTLFSFDGAAAGGGPRSGLIKVPDGIFYGVTDAGGTANRGTVFELSEDGSNHRVLHNFIGGGETVNPYAGLLQGSDGTFYATSWAGGSVDGGTVYKIESDGSGFGVLHSFASEEGDGANPHAGLIEGSDGAIYGTTVQGGTSQNGTVFKLNKNGSDYRVLRRFTGSPGDGIQPYGGLLETADGTLYGTTAFGGSAGRGTIFKMNKDGSSYAVLRSFSGMPDAASPYAALIIGSDGFLYGSTPHGGTANTGTVFKLKSDNSEYSVLHSLVEGDGRHAFARLTEGMDGALFGTTALGGAADQGTLFKINKDGTRWGVIHDFTGLEGDGSRPSANANLVLGGDGALYGTTYSGGLVNAGTIFRVDENGLNVVYSMTGEHDDGANPYAGLIKASDGALYGTTLNGGLTCGSVFRLAPMASLLLRKDGELTLNGPPKHRFAIQFREDDIGSLSAWQFLTNVTLVTDQLTFPVPLSSSKNHRFYRAELVP